MTEKKKREHHFVGGPWSHALKEKYEELLRKAKAKSISEKSESDKMVEFDTRGDYDDKK